MYSFQLNLVRIQNQLASIKNNTKCSYSYDEAQASYYIKQYTELDIILPAKEHILNMGDNIEHQEKKHIP